MLLIRDRLIEEMRKRTRPICVSCLGAAASTDYLAVFEASQDGGFVFERTHGICPECRCQQQLLFQPFDAYRRYRWWPKTSRGGTRNADHELLPRADPALHPAPPDHPGS